MEERKQKDGRVLLLEREGKILTLLFHGNRLYRADACDPKGVLLNNIYIGKVKNVVHNIQAAFVEFTPGMLCFLPLKELDRPLLTNRKFDGRLVAGDEIVLQIRSEAQKTKEAGASCHLSFPGKYIVLTSGKRHIGYSSRLSETDRKRLREFAEGCSSFLEAEKEYGVMFRTSAGELEDFSLLEKELLRLKEEGDILQKYAMHRTCFSLLKKAPVLWLKNLQDYDSLAYEKILTAHPGIYREAKEYLEKYQPEEVDKLVFYEDALLPLYKLYSVEARLSEALDRKVWLKSGGYLVIDRTEALTCIDVNSGKYVGKKSGDESYFHINLEAAEEIAVQLRLRNLSGIIIIDFINMKAKEKNRQLMNSLKKFLDKDPVRTSVVDMTPLGLVEVTRKKEKKSLWEQLRREK